jgi:hypothetical protein
MSISLMGYGSNDTMSFVTFGLRRENLEVWVNFVR